MDTQSNSGEKTYNVLFLCTGNSARSILSEAILNREGAGKFKAFSAGSQPTGKVNPYAIKHLNSLGYDTDGYRSKSWDEFSADGAPDMDFIFTVCGNAADEVCPIWPGHPMSAHWGVPDPAGVEGSDAEISAAFADAYRSLYDRIAAFLSLPIEAIDSVTLKKKLVEIGSGA